MLFWTSMSLFLVWNIKDNILKNVSDQTVVGPPLTSIVCEQKILNWFDYILLKKIYKNKEIGRNTSAVLTRVQALIIILNVLNKNFKYFKSLKSLKWITSQMYLITVCLMSA